MLGFRGCGAVCREWDSNVSNIDDHPLRYRRLTQEIERVLVERELGRQPNGYVEGTLPTAIKIAEVVEEYYGHA